VNFEGLFLISSLVIRISDGIVFCIFVLSCDSPVMQLWCCIDVEGRGYSSANGEKGGSSSRERPSFESGRGSRRRGVYGPMLYLI